MALLKVRKKTLERIFSPEGKYCKNVYTYSDQFYHSAFNSNNPSRPSRRPKPDDLLAHLTARGPYYRESYVYTWSKWTRTYESSCSGVSTPTEQNRWFYQIPHEGVAWPELAVPSWEIPMRNKINDFQVSLADTIGEWRETAKAVRGGAYALRRAYRFFRRLRRMPRHRWPRELKHLWQRRRTLTFGDLPSKYLAIQFGILPWVQFAVDSAEALERAATKGLMQKFCVTRNVDWSKNFGSPLGVGAAVAQMNKSVRAVFYVRYRPYTPDFTAGNGLDALWAGTPMSFMVDWFISVGDWLAAVGALNNVESVRGTVVTRTRKSVVDTRPSGYTYVGGLAGFPVIEQRGTYMRQEYRREAASVIGLPLTLEWKGPTSNGFGKLMSSLAILHSLR